MKLCPGHVNPTTYFTMQDSEDCNASPLLSSISKKRRQVPMSKVGIDRNKLHVFHFK